MRTSEFAPERMVHILRQGESGAPSVALCRQHQTADGYDRVAYSPADVARFFGVSIATIERAARARTLPSFRIRDRRLIPRRAVEGVPTRAYDTDS